MKEDDTSKRRLSLYQMEAGRARIECLEGETKAARERFAA